MYQEILPLRLRVSAVSHFVTDSETFSALGLILIGLVAAQMPQPVWFKWSGSLMFAGIVLFSGSLYILSITGVRWLGAITPVGGIAFILAWFMFVVAVVRAP